MMKMMRSYFVLTFTQHWPIISWEDALDAKLLSQIKAEFQVSTSKKSLKGRKVFCLTTCHGDANHIKHMQKINLMVTVS